MRYLIKPWYCFLNASAVESYTSMQLFARSNASTGGGYQSFRRDRIQAPDKEGKVGSFLDNLIQTRVGFAVLIASIVFLGPDLNAHANIDCPGTIGFGYGVPFGGVGVRYEQHIGRDFTTTAGVGYFHGQGGWAFGIRKYFEPEKNARIKFRVAAYYGTNTTSEDRFQGNLFYHLEEGFSAGLGTSVRFGKRWTVAFDYFSRWATIPEHREENEKEFNFAVSFYRCIRD